LCENENPANPTLDDADGTVLEGGSDSATLKVEEKD